MKNFKILMIILLGSALTVQSCKDDDDDEMVMSNQTFVTEAASGNLLEIQAGALAAEKGVNAEVKTYGQLMVADHTNASAQLVALATAKSLTVTNQLTAKHQQQLSALQPLTGVAFDKAFMNLMVQSHQEQVNLFEAASTTVQDQDLRTFAADKLPVLQMHLQEAQELNATINP